ncbi:hypothetical protein AA313_de0209650 [Arthrobotrys entomopaga]|nr:hypothetical protein AA313_de0209650 [Arthrobotrys entomopaga]
MDSHPLRYSTGSLSPAAIDIPYSGRDSQLSLASINSTSSDFELSDFNPTDDEPTTIQKLVQKAKKQTMNAIRKAGSTETEPISPTKRRKSNSTYFAKNVAKNVSKALEAGLIKMEELSEPQGNAEGFDYKETIQLLQELTLGEPMNKFLRDLEKHLTIRRTQELQEMEAIYTERSWRKYHEFLTRARTYDEPPPLAARQSPLPAPLQFESPQAQEYRSEDLVAGMTLVVCRSTEVFLNREPVYYPFLIGYFSANDFKVWLDGYFDPPISFTENHLVLREYNIKFVNLQDLERFLNFDIPMQLGHTRTPQDDTITVVIHENWLDEYVTFTRGHH